MRAKTKVRHDMARGRDTRARECTLVVARGREVGVLVLGGEVKGLRALDL